MEGWKMDNMGVEQDFGTVLAALRFAAQKHNLQKRKDQEGSPYINHPIAVVEILWHEGSVRDLTTLTAAALHDTIEDTNTTQEEVRALFGEEVLKLIMEVTDDKSLPKQIRKDLQVEHAPHLSNPARQIKLADKIHNLHDIIYSPPADWSLQRRVEYLDWTKRVIDGLRGQNPQLEAEYDRVLVDGRQQLASEGAKTGSI